MEKRSSFSRRVCARVLQLPPRMKREGERAQYAYEGVVPSFRFALLVFATTKRKRKRNADRRSLQPAVLLARPRLQQEAHAYRRSTTVLTQGTRHPKGPASGHASWDVD